MGLYFLRCSVSCIKCLNFLLRAVPSSPHTSNCARGGALHTLNLHKVYLHNSHDGDAHTFAIAKCFISQVFYGETWANANAERTRAICSWPPSVNRKREQWKRKKESLLLIYHRSSRACSSILYLHFHLQISTVHRTHCLNDSHWTVQENDWFFNRKTRKPTMFSVNSDTHSTKVRGREREKKIILHEQITLPPSWWPDFCPIPFISSRAHTFVPRQIMIFCHLRDEKSNLPYNEQKKKSVPLQDRATRFTAWNA